MVAEKTDTRRKVVEKQAEAASLGERGRSTGRREVQSWAAAQRSEQALAEWPSLLEDMSEGDGGVTEDCTRYLSLSLYRSFTQVCREF